MKDPLKNVLYGFAIDGQIIELKDFVRGHLHNTYIGTWEHDGHRTRFLHQRINNHVFRDVKLLMSNIERISSHLKKHLTPGEQTLEIVRAKDGGLVVEAKEEVWRTYKFIENSVSYDRIPGPEYAKAAAQMLGRFHLCLADLAVSEVRETIPEFQNIALRFKVFVEAHKADTYRRAKGAQSEIRQILDNQSLFETIENGLKSAQIPLRIVHGDPKINNILFQTNSAKAIAMVDLDTAMPGTALYDFGDLVRSSSLDVEEDSAKIQDFDVSRFALLSEGYLSQMRSLLTPSELALLPLAPQIITITLAARFLSDYLTGDAYFKVQHPEQNLLRARTQLFLLESMKQNYVDMQKLIKRMI